jgi:alpha-beta hydrolase superfamily lysophospholipase
VLRSAKSAPGTKADDCADLVIDTAQIAQWESRLGSEVTDVPIKDARHDVFLSIPESRASAYEALGDWLDRQQPLGAERRVPGPPARRKLPAEQ